MIEDSRESRSKEDVDILDKIRLREEDLKSWPGIKEHPCRQCGNRCGCGCGSERCQLCPPCSEEGVRIRDEILMEEEGVFFDPDKDEPAVGDDGEQFLDEE
jgi:hypothetical protein